MPVKPLLPTRSRLLAYILKAVICMTGADAFGQAEVQNPSTLPAGAGVFWKTTGNANTVDGTHFFGTTDMVPLNFRIGNVQAGRIDSANGNVFWGYKAGLGNTTGTGNVAIGKDALYRNTDRSNLIAIGDSALFNNGLGAVGAFEGTKNLAIGSKAMFSNTTGTQNTAIGARALYANTSGLSNTAAGYNALSSNLNGSNNTAVGFNSLVRNTTGFDNTAIGFSAMQTNLTGSGNTALGYRALDTNISGDYSTAVGYSALTNNTLGTGNVAIGSTALRINVSGLFNTAVGTDALQFNTIGDDNVAVGHLALFANSEANYNTALGTEALYNNGYSSRNVAVGYQALYQLGYPNGFTVYNGYNTAVGYQALQQCNPTDGTSTGTGKRNTAVGGLALNSITTGKMNTGIGFICDAPGTADNATALGYNSIATGSNFVRVGNTAVTSIFGAVNFNTSDARFKTDVVENVPGLSFINALRPVTYLFQKEKYSRHIGEEQEEDYVQMLRKQDASGKRSSGFIAQEVDSLAKQLGYDFNGLYKPQNEKDTYGLGYSQFVVPLVKAVQELKAIIDMQQKQIEELQKK